MKSVIIVGGGGYLGSKMASFFLDNNYQVTVLDRFYFGDIFKDNVNKNLKIIKNDIRFFDKAILKNIDVVINLASISNDPASELDPKLTKDVNYIGAVRLAKFSKEAGVKKYIFASSCSVYGHGEKILNENSDLAPISEYAKSKINAEKEILKLSGKNFCVTVLRLSTLYGLSEKRMRFDLIINIMTLHAWKNNKIFIMGGGKQWRPLMHLDDCINAFYLVIKENNLSKINGQVFNVGSDSENYQVFKVALNFKKFFPNLIIEDTPDDPDKRSYHVSFKKIKKVLKFITKKNIDDGIIEIKKALEEGIIKNDLKTSTLKYYQYLMDAHKLIEEIKIDKNLF
ncbi:SDR family oxidoreductase [Candidatus Roizmanbacteria bacterium]|nr:SDR family oxidoreductase [Candidatus Roizmanbacteria bacterium]